MTQRKLFPTKRISLRKIIRYRSKSQEEKIEGTHEHTVSKTWESQRTRRTPYYDQGSVSASSEEFSSLTEDSSLDEALNNLEMEEPYWWSN
mmetsp:Transcript_7046/g.8119  ORF Transcript_7046/g.8119 Transcript_7046/m.8119 type:complete len:91 (+) Transcript_7046:543-815(+)